MTAPPNREPPPAPEPATGGTALHPAAPGSWRRWAPLAAALVIGGVLRARAFEGVALGWDPCEYVWAVEGPHLPHSPYILYLWAGMLAARLAPTEVALSALSWVASLAAIAGLWLAVGRQTGSRAAAAVAALALAVFPIPVTFGGAQEVYALQAALLLGALALAPHGFTSGLLFGAAFATHTGTVFAMPAWLAFLVAGRAGGHTLAAADRTMPPRIGPTLARAVAGAAVLPLLCGAFVLGVFAHLGATPLVGTTLAYLRGIAPPPGHSPVSRLGHELVAYAGRALDGTFGMLPSSITAISFSCLALALLRPRWLAAWLLLAAPYAVYESLIGVAVDPGIYAVFLAPPLAAILAGALAAVSERLPAGRARQAAVVVALAILVPSAVFSYRLADALPSRREVLASDLARHMRWIRDHTPPDAVVLQPAELDNPNLLPANTARRPIIRRQGVFLLFTGQRWSPLNQSSYEPLTPEVLDRLDAAGTPILAMAPEPSLVPALANPDSRSWQPWPGAEEDGRAFLFALAPHR